MVTPAEEAPTKVEAAEAWVAVECLMEAEEEEEAELDSSSSK